MPQAIEFSGRPIFPEPRFQQVIGESKRHRIATGVHGGHCGCHKANAQDEAQPDRREIPQKNGKPNDKTSL